ncbi:MAG: cytochrome d ubiquinol oxidase subunit II [Acetobacteraceae bacterium]
MDATNLALFWVAVVGASIMMYVILDGFDLGVGILSGIAGNEARRDHMIATISPFWDGNETWLVVIGTTLFAAFPAVYAVFLPAFYLPVLLLLFGLIFRGVAFEFRVHGTGRRFWEVGFCIGSLVATFVQGAAIGAMIRGIPVTDGQYSGGPLEWLAPLPVLTGLGLILGYALLGACWIVWKTDGSIHEWARGLIPRLAIATLCVLATAAILSLGDRDRIASHLPDRAWGFIFPVLAVVSLASAVFGKRTRGDHWPFVMTSLFFMFAFATLAVVFWPFMIPYTLTVGNAAAPDQSLSFLFWGAGIVVLPLIAAYTVGVYRVFGGKISSGYE